MDYFGQLADDLVDISEEIERLHPIDGAKVIKGLERVMKLAIDAENARHERRKLAAAVAAAGFSHEQGFVIATQPQGASACAPLAAQGSLSRDAPPLARARDALELPDRRAA